MKFCKSIYLAGSVVSIDDICSYEDYKKLGLVCPVCNEPLFFRKNSIYTRVDTSLYNYEVIKHSTYIPKKIIDIDSSSVSNSVSNSNSKYIERSASFVHFSGRKDCELKTKSYKGTTQDYKSTLGVQVRNQRLRLYNLYLWEFLSSTVEIENKDLREVLKDIGRKRVEKVIGTLIEAWNNIISEILIGVDKMYEQYVEYIPNSNRDIDIKMYVGTDYYKEGLYKSQVHVDIVKEVVKYLATVPGNYVLKKLFEYSIVLAYTSYLVGYGNNDSNIKDIIRAAVSTIYTTQWIYLIGDKLYANNSRK